MSPSVLEALFLQLEEVAQLEPGEGDAPSIGLGLAVVSQIVKNLGGQLRVQSTLGAGTSFTFVVPLHLPQSSASTTRPPRVMPPQERWEMDILLSELGKSHMAPPEPAPCSAESSRTFARDEASAVAKPPPPQVADSTTVTPRPRFVQQPASSPAILQVPEQSAIPQVRRPSLADTVRSTSSPCPQEPNLLEK